MGGQYIIKTELKGIGWKSVDWIYLTQVTDNWRLMDFQVP